MNNPNETNSIYVTEGRNEGMVADPDVAQEIVEVAGELVAQREREAREKMPEDEKSRLKIMEDLAGPEGYKSVHIERDPVTDIDYIFLPDPNWVSKRERGAFLLTPQGFYRLDCRSVPHSVFDPNKIVQNMNNPAFELENRRYISFNLSMYAKDGIDYLEEEIMGINRLDERDNGAMERLKDRLTELEEDWARRPGLDQWEKISDMLRPPKK